MTAPHRRPRFTLGEEDDSDHDDRPENGGVPRIRVEDAQRTGQHEKEASNNSRDEERHVGFAAQPVVEGEANGVRRTNGTKERENGSFSTRPFERAPSSSTYPPSSPDRRPSHAETPPAKPSAPPTFASKLEAFFTPIPPALAWIPPKLNWKGLRPVVRSSIAAWCGLLLLLCGPSERMLGQAGFLVLVGTTPANPACYLLVATISPACLPIANTIEQTFFQFLLVSLSWAWGCIAMAIAHAARSRYHFTQSQFLAFAAAKYANSGMTAVEISAAVKLDIFHGHYLEASSSAATGILMGAACGFFLWLRGYLGPGPALFGVIFGAPATQIHPALRLTSSPPAIILQVIMATIGVLFPYPYYTLGLVFFIPFTCQHAINLACTFLVFPETLAHQFSDRLIATLAPLQRVIQQQEKMLKVNPRTPEWLEFKSLKQGTAAALGNLALLGASESNLTREISYARASGKDLSRILQHMRVLSARTSELASLSCFWGGGGGGTPTDLANERIAAGFVFFYEVIEKHLHRDYSDAKGGPVADHLVIHLGHSRPPSQAGSANPSPASTRPSSPVRSGRNSPRGSVESADPEALKAALQRAEHPSSPRRAFQLDTPTPSPLAPTPRPAAFTRHQSTPILHPALHSSRPSTISLTDLADGSRTEPSTPGGTRHQKRQSRSRHRHTKGASHVSLSSLLHDVLHPHVDIKPVGLVESMARDEEHIEEIVRLLSATSSELLSVVDRSVGHLMSTVHRLKSREKTWPAFVCRFDPAAHEAAVKKSEAQLRELRAALDAYRDEKRLDVIRPFARLFDPYGAGAPREGEELQAPPSHRGLYWAFSYQSSLIGWTEALVDLFEEALKIEKKRKKARVWFPDWSKARFARTSAEGGYQDVVRFASSSMLLLATNLLFVPQDPDSIAEFDTQAFSAPRHPDYRPPKTVLQLFGVRLHRVAARLAKRDVLFGYKAAVLLGLCSMPAYFSTTCFFFYRERGIWVYVLFPSSLRIRERYTDSRSLNNRLIMIALTTTQFVGDTSAPPRLRLLRTWLTFPSALVFGFLVRVVGTFFGALVGLLIWSIAAQNGRGNPYAVGATCAVVFPFIFFYRVHFMPPMTAILPPVTTMLVLGYSVRFVVLLIVLRRSLTLFSPMQWQNGHNPALSSVGWGWDVAWRRFVCVMIVAFVWTYIPPKTTQKVSIRRTYARCVDQLGGVMCQILSFANTKTKPTKPPKVIVKNLAMLRMKVDKTTQAKAMARYELSLQGPWPAEHYAALQALQMYDCLVPPTSKELLDLLTQLTSVICALDAKWTKALLHRSQLSNPHFLQDLLTTFHLLSAALDHGMPLPMIYNPLLERFLKPPEVQHAGHGYGYDVTIGDIDIEGLPQHVTLDVICSLEYLRFSCGISQCYAIINFVAKSLVGENYLLYGLEMPQHRRGDADDFDTHFRGIGDSRRTSIDDRSSMV
ncbi:SPOSA6832_03240 [Sporobolomyces salmonicolor]|uniref:SPOSA6832_03240-mRNA-1:cds n=1 Tax=Sporidiobolus salmonicolor TaxID=5005 RepID=A0A0D6ENM8_SPOSA|nr:SPOSA6832_03240 [Sporobolomyces salmonicolor]